MATSMLKPAKGKSSTSKSKPKKIDLTTLPPLYKCTCCGKITQSPAGVFYKNTQNHLYDGSDGYVQLCVQCCNDFFRSVLDKYRDEEMALMSLCAEIGFYYSEQLYRRIKDKDPSVINFGEYVKQYNLNQFKNATFVDFAANFVRSEKVKDEGKKKEEDIEFVWTEEELENIKTVTEVIGYDPFEGYRNIDRRYLFNELVKYLDDDVMEDNFKLSQIIQIVNNNNQIRQYDLMIAQLNPLLESKEIQTLNDLKNKLVSSTDKIAKENEISVKNRSNKDAGKSTLTYLMRDLREKNFEKAEADYYAQLKSEGTRWAADISMDAIRKNAYFDENDLNEIGGIRAELVKELQAENDDLREEKRKLLLEIQNLKNAEKDE